MKIIFMGTPDFSVPALKALIENKAYEVIAVYTQPPRPAKRGQKLQYSAIHQTAKQYNIPVFTPVNFKEESSIEEFEQLDADLAIVVAYGLLLPKAILEAPLYGCVNIHASILPRWRGAAPINRAIMGGDSETGITIMQMDEGLDTGDMLSVSTIPIEPHMTAGILHDRLALLGASMITPIIESIKQGKSKPIQQPEEGVTYAHKLLKSEGKIDWQQPAEVIEKHVKGLHPWPMAFFSYQGEIIKLLEADIVFLDSSHDLEEVGRVLDDQLLILCGKGAIRPVTIQRAGKKPMNVKDFLRGYPIAQGSRIS